jgi:hypothetical protein
LVIRMFWTTSLIQSGIWNEDVAAILCAGTCTGTGDLHRHGKRGADLLSHDRQFTGLCVRVQFCMHRRLGRRLSPGWEIGTRSIRVRFVAVAYAAWRNHRPLVPPLLRTVQFKTTLSPSLSTPPAVSPRLSFSLPRLIPRLHIGQNRRYCHKPSIAADAALLVGAHVGANHPPGLTGSFDAMSTDLDGSASVRGWAVDWDQDGGHAHVHVEVTVDGKVAWTATANTSRFVNCKVPTVACRQFSV